MLDCLLLSLMVFIPGDDADKWLQKMADVYKKAPLSMDIEAKMNINQMGMQMAMDMTGTMTYKDETHQHTTMAVQMKMPESSAQQGMPSSMDMAIKTVFDGEIMWIETNMISMGMKQVMKMSKETMETMAEKQGLQGMSFTSGGLDPSKMIETMKSMMEIQVAGQADGKVTLEAELTEETKATMGDSGLDIGKFTIVMDEANVFPMQIQVMSGDAPMMDMTYSNVKFLETVEDALFEYEPPEGVMVQDMDTMLGAAAQ